MRERLGEFYDQAGKCAYLFTAQFQCYGKTDDGNNVMLLLDVRTGGKFSADHVWCHRSKVAKQLELQKGDIVQFVASVDKYPRQGKSFTRAEDVEYDYCFKKIREMIVIQRRNDV